MNERPPTPCAIDVRLFQHPLLSESADIQHFSEAKKRRFDELRRQAHRACAACPEFVDCLYHAVAEVDIFGFVACTTQSERDRMRDTLDWTVVEDGDLAPRRMPRTSFADVVRMRELHPDETFQELADRLGCSHSTVKRKLRRARNPLAVLDLDAPQVKPTVDEVLDCFDELGIVVAYDRQEAA